jgi:hypothetical protein
MRQLHVPPAVIQWSAGVRAQEIYQQLLLAHDAVFGAVVPDPELERQDIQDVNELVGGKFETWQQADAALEQFILRAGPECDRDLIPPLYRRPLSKML